MAERRVLVKAFAERYQKGSKSQRGVVLDEFTSVSGYNRSYASWLLRWHGRKVRAGERLVLVGDVTSRVRRARPRVYEGEVVRVLKVLWELADYSSGKRLVAALPRLVEALQRHGELEVGDEVRSKLMAISAATIDRVLQPYRQALALRRRAKTKPGTLLKHQIPIRTFAQWNDARPGFVEADLVGHDGGNTYGDFVHTLDLTDVATGWTELDAVPNRARCWVLDALQGIRQQLPFPLLGIDADNGGEFINHHLLTYCRNERITFTRSRAYRKNDSCFVEQKNWSVVRRFVGYQRLDSPEELRVLKELYAALRLYVNFFIPSMKLLEKVRVGSRVRKRYDRPQTPYQRVLASPHVKQRAKRKLRRQYPALNPAQLVRTIRRLQRRLLRLAAARAESTTPSQAVERAGPGGKVFDLPTGPCKAPPELRTRPTAPATDTHISPSLQVDFS